VFKPSTGCETKHVLSHTRTLVNFNSTTSIQLFSKVCSCGTQRHALCSTNKSYCYPGYSVDIWECHIDQSVFRTSVYNNTLPAKPDTYREFRRFLGGDFVPQPRTCTALAVPPLPVKISYDCIFGRDIPLENNGPAILVSTPENSLPPPYVAQSDDF
jgi:hypothetical protein